MRPDIARRQRRGENITRQAYARCFKAVTRHRYLLYQVSLTEMFIHSHRHMTSMARVTRCRRVSRCDSDRKVRRTFVWNVSFDVSLSHYGNTIGLPTRLMTMAALVRLKRSSVQLRHAALEVKGTCVRRSFRMRYHAGARFWKSLRDVSQLFVRREQVEILYFTFRPKLGRERTKSHV